MRLSEPKTVRKKKHEVWREFPAQGNPLVVYEKGACPSLYLSMQD